MSTLNVTNVSSTNIDATSVSATTMEVSSLQHSSASAANIQLNADGSISSNDIKTSSLQHSSASAPNIELNADGSIVNNIVFNEESGTSYTFSLTDNGKLVKFTSASATTATVPPNSSVDFPIGAVIGVVQYGAGTLTIEAGSGVTLNSTVGSASASFTDQFAGGQIYQMDTDEWLLIGSVE